MCVDWSEPEGQNDEQVLQHRGQVHKQKPSSEDRLDPLRLNSWYLEIYVRLCGFTLLKQLSN